MSTCGFRLDSVLPEKLPELFIRFFWRRGVHNFIQVSLALTRLAHKSYSTVASQPVREGSSCHSSLKQNDLIHHGKNDTNCPTSTIRNTLSISNCWVCRGCSARSNNLHPSCLPYVPSSFFFIRQWTDYSGSGGFGSRPVVGNGDQEHGTYGDNHEKLPYGCRSYDHLQWIATFYYLATKPYHPKVPVPWIILHIHWFFGNAFEWSWQWWLCQQLEQELQ